MEGWTGAMVLFFFRGVILFKNDLCRLPPIVFLIMLLADLRSAFVLQMVAIVWIYVMPPEWRCDFWLSIAAVLKGVVASLRDVAFQTVLGIAGIPLAVMLGLSLLLSSVLQGIAGIVHRMVGLLAAVVMMAFTKEKVTRVRRAIFPRSLDYGFNLRYV